MHQALSRHKEYIGGPSRRSPTTVNKHLQSSTIQVYNSDFLEVSLQNLKLTHQISSITIRSSGVRQGIVLRMNHMIKVIGQIRFIPY